jgi:hypothetical protein
MGCSTLAHEQSSNCHLNTFGGLFYGNCAWHFTVSAQLEEAAQWVHKKVAKFLPLLHTKMHYPSVREEKKNPNTFFLICVVIGYTMNTDWIIC